MVSVPPIDPNQYTQQNTGDSPTDYIRCSSTNFGNSKGSGVNQTYLLLTQ